MSSNIRFEGVHPIGNSDPMALPVRMIGPAVAFYTNVLGFRLISKTETNAYLERDGVQVGLAKNDADPTQASVYFAVQGSDELREEYLARNLEPSATKIDDNGTDRYRVFFAQEPYGVCFCFGSKLVD